MSLLISCLFIAALMPYLAKVPLIMAIQKSSTYDNNYPRAQASNLTGFAARAWAAHQNGFESLLVFGVAVLSAIVTHHVTAVVEWLAVIHILARCIYYGLYWMDLASPRTMVWAVGYLSAMAILGISIF